MIVACASIIGLQCKSPYIPPGSAASVNILHIEGIINTGGDTTLITLTRTVKLTDTINSNPELNATVSLQGNDGTTYPLVETGNGNYIYPDFSFLSNTGKQYSLNIITYNGKKYRSDFVTAKNSPPIDSVYCQVNASGVQVFSSTHDPSGSTRYYRWDYDETWIVRSFYDSYYETQTTPKDSIIIRPVYHQIDSCWLSGKSSTLILNSSAKLSQDIITANPVASVASTSEKFTSAYSLLLRQYALSSDAFNYWQNLKKNTEQLGSIFDAQPSQIQGNIHCITSPSEPVLGYLSMGFVAKKRLFIYKNALPSFRPLQNNTGCSLDTVALKDLPGVFAYNAIPINAVYNTRRMLIGYSFTPSPVCVDCTIRGTNIKPSYWISKIDYPCTSPKRY